MANINSVPVTLKIRHDDAATWTAKNPTLAAGEYGLEDDTFLLKIGDGITSWRNLKYLNKLNASYFQQLADGTITFSAAFQQTINNLIANAGTGGEVEQLTITNAPVNPTDAVNKQYVDQAIAAAGHLTRTIVEELPSTEDADEYTIYMIRNGDVYDEYMFINDMFNKIGDTSINDYNLPIATAITLGGVYSSNEDNQIAVTQQGFMTLNRVSTSLLFVPDGDMLILNGGNA